MSQFLVGLDLESDFQVGQSQLWKGVSLGMVIGQINTCIKLDSLVDSQLREQLKKKKIKDKKKSEKGKVRKEQ